MRFEILYEMYLAVTINISKDISSYTSALAGEEILNMSSLFRHSTRCSGEKKSGPSQCSLYDLDSNERLPLSSEISGYRVPWLATRQLGHITLKKNSNLSLDRAFITVEVHDSWCIAQG